MATNGAVESKWCNWELGYGDAQKFDTDNIALFPIKPENTYDYDLKVMNTCGFIHILHITMVVKDIRMGL